MIRCAMCGKEYEPVPSCPPSCPLASGCHFVCCPHCGYQNIDASQSSSVKFVRKIWSKYVESMGALKTKAAGNDRFTLANLDAGDRAHVVRVECERAASSERLMAYGLVEGQTILLVQKHPALVIRVDETDLALDEFVARCIHVRPILVLPQKSSAA